MNAVHSRGRQQTAPGTTPGTTTGSAAPDGLIPRRRIPFWKRTIDILGALTGLVVVLPLLALIALAVVTTSRGGPFYRHARVGRGGREFTTWKFRSMRVGADRQQEALSAQNEASGFIFKMRDDPRITAVGRFLRLSSLDELPQLWNVLKGDMSLVGPRPPLPSEVARYAPEHRRRLEGVPGITGLWQVRARHRHDFEEMVALDVEYLETMSFWGDIRVLLLTIPTVLFARGSY